MLYFLLVLVVLLPLISHVVTIIFNKNISVAKIIFCLIAPLSLFSNFIIPFQYMQFNIFQGITWGLFLAIVLSSTTYVVWKFIYLKAWKLCYKNGIVTPLICSIGLLIILIATLFITVQIDYDTMFSVNFSINFKNSIYSTEDYLGPTLHGAYTTAAYGFIFTSLIPNQIISIYSILIPMIYVALFLGIAAQVINQYIKNFQWIYMLFALGSLILIYFMANSTFKLSWTPICAILLLVILQFKKIDLLNISILLIGSGFFSSTGYLVSFPLLIALLIMLFLSKRFWEIVLFIPLLIYLMGPNIYITYYRVGEFYMAVMIISVILFAISILTRFFYKKHTWDFSISNNKIFVKENNKFMIFSFILLTALPCVLLAIYVDVFSILTTIVYLLLHVVLIFLYYNALKNENSLLANIIGFLFITIFVASFEYLGVKVLEPDQELIWRLILLMTGLPTTPISPSLFIATMTLVLIIGSERNYSWIKAIFNKFTHLPLNYKFFVKSRGLNATFLSSFLIVATSLLPLVNYDSNVFFTTAISRTLNYDYLSSQEREFLSQIDFNNYHKTYIADFPAGAYLNEATNLTTFLNYNVEKDLYYRSQLWQFGGLITSIYFWNIVMAKVADPFDIFGDLEQEAANILINTVEDINNGSLPYKGTKTNEEFDSLDYIFLYKYHRDGNYYDLIRNELVVARSEYSNIFESENLLCLEKTR